MAGTEWGVATTWYLRSFFARIFLGPFFTPAVPAGRRVVRRYDSLLLRENVRVAPIMCVPKASDTTIYVSGRRAASAG